MLLLCCCVEGMLLLGEDGALLLLGDGGGGHRGRRRSAVALAVGGLLSLCRIVLHHKSVGVVSLEEVHVNIRFSRFGGIFLIGRGARTSSSRPPIGATSTDRIGDVGDCALLVWVERLHLEEIIGMKESYDTSCSRSWRRGRNRT